MKKTSRSVREHLRLLGVSNKVLAENILQSQPTTRILFMSGYAGDKIENYDDLKPRMGFLQKVFSSTDLCNKVRDLLNQRLE